jgi:hypothetical protein
MVYLALLSPDIKWELHDGANKAEIIGGQIIIHQVGDKQTNDPAYALGILNSRSGNWSLNLKFSFPTLGEHGARVSLGSGKYMIAFVGADKWYKAMSTYLGSKMVDSRPADSATHELGFSYSNGRLKIVIDGRNVADELISAAPDHIHVGSGPGGNTGTQTEIEVHDVLFRELAIPSAKAHNPDKSKKENSHETPTKERRSIARERLAVAFGVDTLMTSGFVPTEEGRLRVSARESQLVLPPTTLVEFAPLCTRPDLDLTEITMFVNGKAERTKIILSPKTLPIFSCETPRYSKGYMRVTIVATDSSRKQVVLLHSEIRTIPKSEAEAVKLDLVGEKVVFGGGTGAMKTLDVFFEDSFVGRVVDLAKFAMDGRRIPPGQHVLWIIASNLNGEVFLPFRSLIDVRPRFKVSTAYDHGTFVVEGERTSLPVHVVVEPGTDLAKTRLYGWDESF